MKAPKPGIQTITEPGGFQKKIGYKVLEVEAGSTREAICVDGVPQLMELYDKDNSDLACIQIEVWPKFMGSTTWTVICRFVEWEKLTSVPTVMDRVRRYSEN